MVFELLFFRITYQMNELELQSYNFQPKHSTYCFQMKLLYCRTDYLYSVYHVFDSDNTLSVHYVRFQAMKSWVLICQETSSPCCYFFHDVVPAKCLHWKLHF